MRELSILEASQLSSRKMNAILAVLIVMICAALANVLYANWTNDRQRASIELGNISAAISQDILRNIELFDLSIQGVIDGIGNPAVMSAPKDLRQLVLFGRAATVPFLGQMLLIGPTGDLLATSRTANVPVRNYGDRDYFRIHQQRPDFGLFVSRPLTSRTDGAQMIAFSRRITRPDGSFGGVVAGTLLIDSLHQLFARMHLGDQGAITLFRNDGSVIMREPFNPEIIGTRNPPPILFDRASRSDEGEYESVSVVDGVHRIYHFARIGKLPLVVNVGFSAAEIHHEWWHRTLLICTVVAAASIMILLLNMRLGRELRRRTLAEATLTKLVDKDGLTGVANRRCFDRVLQTEWLRAQRQGFSLALLMIDADQFKAYNDRLGHAAGDDALRQIAHCIDGQSRRAGDLAARYGGEEFAMILPGLSRHDASRMGETVRQAVARLGIAHPASQSGQFTVSIGCASRMPADGGSVEDLITAADQALYRSKLAGRNLVTADDPAPVRLKLVS